MTTTADPRGELFRLLTAWSEMSDDTASQAAVDQVRQDIERLIKANPTRSTGWFKEWRRSNRTAKLA